MNRWGIIGYGRIAKRFIENLKTTDGILYAIASRSNSNVPSEVWYEDYEALLCDPQVDMVYIALPHKFHYEWIKKAIEHHKPVLCEKPLVLTMQQMLDIILLQQQYEVPVMEALKSRFIPGYLSLKKDLKTIELESIDCGFCYAIEKNNSYLFDPDQGGALNDVGSYSIGFVLDIAKAHIKEMNSQLKMEDGVDVHFKSHLVFENGIIANIEGAMDEKKENVGILKGKKGTITVPYFYRPSYYKIEYTNGEVVERNFDAANDMRYEIIEMMDLVNEHRLESSRMTLEDSFKIISVMEQIRRDE